MKVKELTDYIAARIAEGKLTPESEVVIGSDEFGGLYLYSPSIFHLVCMKDGDNFYRKEIVDREEILRERMENKQESELWQKEYKEQKELLDKINNEWKDALVM